MYSVIIYDIEIIMCFFSQTVPHEAYFNIAELPFHIAGLENVFNILI
jgi:hypothetical protein